MLPITFNSDYLRQLELLRLRSRRAYLGLRQGGHKSIKRGHGLEFADYRKYELGDHPRHIDWGVYARSDKLFIKRFQEEQDLSVLILIDTSASMFTPEGEGKWERARDICLSLAYIALMQQDNVTVAGLGSFVSPRYYGVKSIHDIGNRLDNLRGAAKFDFAKSIQRAAVQVRFPGVAILISDFLIPFENISQSISILRAKNLDMTAIQVLGPSDIRPLGNDDNAIAVDSETGEEISLNLTTDLRNEYAERLIQHNAKLQSFLAENKVSYSLSILSETLQSFMLKNLPETGLIV